MLYLPTGLKCTLQFYEQEALKVISTDEHKIAVNKYIIIIYIFLANAMSFSDEVQINKPPAKSNETLIPPHFQHYVLI